MDASGKTRTIPFEVMVQGDKSPVRRLACLNLKTILLIFL